MDNKKDIQFQMKISSINVMRFSQYDVEDNTKQNTIEYQSDFGIRILEETSEIAIETTVKLKSQGLDKYLGELKTLIKFNIRPFGTVIKKEGGSYQIPNDLMLNLFNIVTGTVRGILHERLRGTSLQNEIFPLIDVNQLIKPNLVK